MAVARRILITGATGTLGQEILRYLLRDRPAEFILIVRDGGAESAQQRVSRQLALHGLTSAERREQVHVIEGDVSLPEMGISTRKMGQLAAEVTHFYHLAALTELSADAADHYRINVEGTREALRLAARCPRLRRFVYFSTAFVAGSRFDTDSLEERLPMRPGHANSYESSKHEAERLVRVEIEKGALSATILRPSIIVGETTEGRISTFRVIYPFLELFAKGTLTSLPCYPRSVLDIVPIDFVVKAAVSLSSWPGSVGKTYHLVSPDPPPVGLFLKVLRKLVPDAAEIQLVDPEDFQRESLPIRQRALLDLVSPYLGYLNRELRFDTVNLAGALRKLDIPFPITDEDFVRRICAFLTKSV